MGNALHAESESTLWDRYVHNYICMYVWLTKLAQQNLNKTHPLCLIDNFWVYQVSLMLKIGFCLEGKFFPNIQRGTYEQSINKLKGQSHEIFGIFFMTRTHMINKLKWFCWKIQYCGDIREVSDSDILMKITTLYSTVIIWSGSGTGRTSNCYTKAIQKLCIFNPTFSFFLSSIYPEFFLEIRKISKHMEYICNVLWRKGLVKSPVNNLAQAWPNIPQLFTLKRGS